MSDENKDPYYYDPFHHSSNSIRAHGGDGSGFPFYGDNNHSIYGGNNLHAGFDPSYMSSSRNSSSFMADCLNGSMDYSSLSRAFDMYSSSSSSLVYTNSIIDDGPSSKKGIENSSASSSSTEVAATTAQAAAQEESKSIDHQPKDHSAEDGDAISKKLIVNNKEKKKGEKRQREPRIAFMTKSEIDHLEDGYRWRKYGQKAVKNSPYPRSYYRCTSQKCTVKKRVERSFEDPSIVITTYEGQHNHHCPATLRGNAAAMLSPSFFSATPSTCFPSSHIQLGLVAAAAAAADPTTTTTTSLPYYHNSAMQLQLPDYGLLQDMVPSSTFTHKHHQP